MRKPCREPLGRAGLGDSLRLIGCCMCCRRNWAKVAEKTQSCNLFHVRFGVLHARTVVFALQAKNIPATRFTIVVSHVSHYRIAFFLPFLSIRPAVPLSIRPAPVSSRAVCCRAEKTARTGARLCSVTFDIPQVSSCCLLGRARRAHWMPCGDSRKHFWLTPHTMTSYSSSQLTLAADAPLRLAACCLRCASGQPSDCKRTETGGRCSEEVPARQSLRLCVFHDCPFPHDSQRFFCLRYQGV